MPSSATAATPPGLFARAAAWGRAHRMLVDGFWMLFWSPLTVLATLAVSGHLAAGSSGRATSVAIALLVGSIVAACTLPMLWRRRYPDLMTGIVAFAHVVQVVAFDTPLPANVVAPVFLYTSARYGRRRLSRVWLGVAVLGSVAAGFRWSVTDPARPVEAVVSTALGCLAVALAAWAWGQWGYQRQRTLDSLRERADALEREHEQGLRLVVEEERTRLAREMHDVVAHSLSVIVVQSDGARYLAGHPSADPAATLAQVARAVETVGSTARTALAETRRMVGVLRADGETAELAPAATLADVEGLVARLREAGVPVTLTVTGDAATHSPLGSGAELAAFRVVQESLTNALKHAGPGARIDVRLAHAPAGVDVVVRDDGRGLLRSDGQGHGLVGMRERVHAWGGTLQAGPHPDGGWLVAAHVPATTSKENR